MIATYILTEMVETIIGATYFLLIFVGVYYLAKAIYVTRRR